MEEVLEFISKHIPTNQTKFGPSPNIIDKPTEHDLLVHLKQNCIDTNLLQNMSVTLELQLSLCNVIVSQIINEDGYFNAYIILTDESERTFNKMTSLIEHFDKMMKKESLLITSQ